MSPYAYDPAANLRQDLVIRQGRTFVLPFGVTTGRFAYAPIATATQAAPCVVITSAAHGIPDDWPITIIGAAGMTALNRQSGFRAVVIDAQTIELNDLITTAAPEYTGGGVIQYPEPDDLADATVRGRIRTAAASDTVLDLEQATHLIIDAAAHTIRLQVPADTTAGFPLVACEYDIEIERAGVVDTLAYGHITVAAEVTT